MLGGMKKILCFLGLHIKRVGYREGSVIWRYCKRCGDLFELVKQ